MSERLRALPPVDRLLAGADTLITDYGRSAVLETLRAVLESVRARLLAGEDVSLDDAALLALAADHLATRFQPTLRPVINATGVIIHTNLGRAPLSAAAQQAMIDAAAGYSTLEYDLDSGQRGSRLLHAEALLCEVTGAEAALVVNNNAAATVLMLAGLAAGREVIVSRGQLVEIGGGFRVPDVMAQSGARLVEVGTTNRTRSADYERAITPETALLMRVHASNFKLVGFVESTPLADMVALAARYGLHAVDDLGSGALVDTAAFGLDHEPTVQDSLTAGAGVVTFSADKLLGGPQAGILVGRRTLIDPLKRHPLARALRADKLCLAALTATLDHYRRGDALENIPVLRMISRSVENIRGAAEAWKARLRAAGLENAAVIEGESTVGGGSLPGATLPTVLLALPVPHPDDFAARLRHAPLPVIARIVDGQVVFDPRTVLPGQDDAFIGAILNASRT